MKTKSEAARVMQEIALLNPVTEGHEAQNPIFFRFFDLEQAVGLTANK